jgi:hypothetical protein
MLFFSFTLLQSIAINGVKISMGKGMILEKFANWLKQNVGDNVFKPIGGCISCMASVIGGIFYWGTVLPIFGFYLIEVWAWVCNVFILVVVNQVIYKKI